MLSYYDPNCHSLTVGQNHALHRRAKKKNYEWGLPKQSASQVDSQDMWEGKVSIVLRDEEPQWRCINTCWFHKEHSGVKEEIIRKREKVVKKKKKKNSLNDC